MFHEKSTLFFKHFMHLIIESIVPPTGCVVRVCRYRSRFVVMTSESDHIRTVFRNVDTVFRFLGKKCAILHSDSISYFAARADGPQGGEFRTAFPL